MTPYQAISPLKSPPRRRLGHCLALSVLVASLTLAALAPAYGADEEAFGPNPETLKRLMQAKPTTPAVRLSPVREAALRASARTLGTQTGLIERAQEIERAVDRRRVEMEAAFRFGDLVIGAGVLPPVLLHTENASAVTDSALRLAGAIYQIKYPARFFSGAPSWRDWLLMGLPSTSKLPEVPNNDQLLPRDDDERRFWEVQIKDAYRSGRAQAQEIFEHNLAMLEEVYTGMRTFYDLYQRNMVSAPIIAKSQEILTKPDPNTIVVGDTLFRITMPAKFNEQTSQWRALQARPAFEPPLAAAPGFDPEQVKEAYRTFQEQQRARAKGERPADKAEVPTTTPTAPVVGVVTPYPDTQIRVHEEVVPSAQMPAAVPSRPGYGTIAPTPPTPSVDLSGAKPLFGG